jgi:hypothetical protein
VSPYVNRDASLWAIEGERGISSNAIFNRLVLGADADKCAGVWFSCNPSDPADFKRCEKLLRQVRGLRERLHEMDAVSPKWSALVEHWQEIVDVFEDECPGVFEDATGWRAARTYKLMKQVMGED